MVFRRDASEFQIIGEPQSDDSGGCGFIPEAMLVEMLGGGAFATRATSIQVRIFVSSLGVFKGVLTKKRHSAKIELPPSMRKVGENKVPVNEDVYLLVTRVHPTKTNVQMDKCVVKGQEPCKTFEQKKFCDMVARVWKSMGVPEYVTKEYGASSKAGAARKIRDEAWVVGVADPTAHLPEGHVFITGLHEKLAEKGLDRVFITRSPCVKAEDGRLLPVATRRPPTMAEDEWKALLVRPLGELIFSNAGERPLPESIAAGDCDGDYYFVCWDSTVLEHMRTCEVGAGRNVVERDADAKSAEGNGQVEIKEKSTTEADFAMNWLAHAHAHMTDARALAEQMLVGKLYNAMKRRADNSQDGLAHPDARALGEAYVQAIDRGKHGDEIQLPQHLRDELSMDKELLGARRSAAPPTRDRAGWYSGLFGQR
jgi:hypothetical protein